VDDRGPLGFEVDAAVLLFDHRQRLLQAVLEPDDPHRGGLELRREEGSHLALVGDPPLLAVGDDVEVAVAVDVGDVGLVPLLAERRELHRPAGPPLHRQQPPSVGDEGIALVQEEEDRRPVAR
jgi:hypothetical protein